MLAYSHITHTVERAAIWDTIRIAYQHLTLPQAIALTVLILLAVALLRLVWRAIR